MKKKDMNKDRNSHLFDHKDLKESVLNIYVRNVPKIKKIKKDEDQVLNNATINKDE